MRVWLIGGGGYLGHAVQRVLVDRGHDVAVVDPMLYEPNRRPVSGVAHVEDTATLDDDDTVVMLASIVGEEAVRLAGPERSHRVNIELPLGLAVSHTGHLIYTSSCSVYGFQAGLLTEGAAMEARGTYAEQKTKVDRSLQSRDARTCVLRLGTLCGDGGGRVRTDLMVNTMAYTASRMGRIVVRGGSQSRPHLHVYDAADAIATAVDARMSGTYNLVGVNLTIRETAEQIAEIIPAKIEETQGDEARSYRVSGAAWSKATRKGHDKDCVRLAAAEIARTAPWLREGPCTNNAKWWAQHQKGDCLDSPGTAHHFAGGPSGDKDGGSPSRR